MVPNKIQIENRKQEVNKKEFKTKAHEKASLYTTRLVLHFKQTITIDLTIVKWKRQGSVGWSNPDLGCIN